MTVGIPDVPPVADPALREFLLKMRNAVVSTVEARREVEAADAEVLDTTNDVPPGAPTDLIAYSLSGIINLSWGNPGDEDLYQVEVWETTASVPPDPVTQADKKIAVLSAVPDDLMTHVIGGRTVGSEWYYWVRSIDTGNNVSGFSSPGAFVVVTGSGGDITAPITISNLTARGGFNNIWLSWTSPPDDDVVSAVVWENTVADISTALRIGTVAALPGMPATFMRAGLENNVTRYYWVQTVDKDGNISDPSNMATSSTITIDPGDLGTAVDFNHPDNLGVTSFISTDTDGSQVVTVRVDYNIIASDKLSGYEVGISEAGGTFVVFPTAENFYQLVARANIVYDVKVRGVDRNGNRTEWSPTVSHTSARNTSTPSPPTGLTATAGIGTVFLAWTNPPNEVVYATDVWESVDSVSFTKIATALANPGQPGKFSRTGLPTGAQRFYYVVARDTSNNVSVPSTVVPVMTAQVTSGDITVDNVLANNVIANVTTTNVLDANVLQSASSLPASLVVSGTGFSLGTLATATTDPAAAINAGTTIINGGKVDVFGNSILNSWRDGGDNTKISGGSIAANTITANSITIGSRGVSIVGLRFQHNSPGSNQVSWTAGTVSYAGGAAPVSVSAGLATYSGSPLYIYWIKDAASLGATATLATAYQSDRIVLATYNGGVALNVTYGGTVIDGSNIKTGSITSNQIQAGTITASLIASGQITGEKIAAGSINATHIEAGTVFATTLTAGSVDTVHLAANAIKAGKIDANVITAREIYGGAVSGMDGSRVGGSGATCYLSTGGGKVLVVAYVEIGTYTGDAAGITIRVYESGTLIGEGAVYCPGNWGAAGVAVPGYVNSSFGFKTYYIECTTTPLSGPYTINQSTIVATELKR